MISKGAMSKLQWQTVEKGIKGLRKIGLLKWSGKPSNDYVPWNGQEDVIRNVPVKGAS